MIASTNKTAPRKYPSGAEKRRRRTEREALEASTPPAAAPVAGELVTRLPLEAIAPDPLNPRTEFDPAELQQLADSLASCGALAPIVVRRAPGAPGRFELIVGERRWRAAKLAGWSEIPAIVKSVADNQVAQMQLAENMLRVDLNAIEIARALERLCGRGENRSAIGRITLEEKAAGAMSQHEAAKVIGRSQRYVWDMLRLLTLPATWQDRILRGEISYKNALELCPYAEDPAALARIETDMQGNPWAYKTREDVARNVKAIAEDFRATPTRSKQPTQRLPRPAFEARPQPQSEVGATPADEFGADELADVGDQAAGRGGARPAAPTTVAAIVAAIAELAADELDQVLVAAARRRKQLRAAKHV